MITKSQQQRFDYLFSVFDRDGSGNLTQDDFYELFAGLGTDEVSTKTARKAARRWWLILKLYGDKNKDRKISKIEWKSWTEGMAGVKDESSKTYRSFSRWCDSVFSSIANEDSSISATEYQNWATALGLAGDAADTFKKFDANGNGSVSKDEFVTRASEFLIGDEKAAGCYLFGNPFK